MTIPVWVMLGFAAWTLVVLISTIAVYRWSLLLTGRAKPTDFNADVPHGSDWYRRAIRAHANCLENLPIYTAIVVAIIVTQVSSPLLDKLAIVFLIARVIQSLIHVVMPLTNTAIRFRFIFFFIQLVCMVWMGVYVALAAA